MTQYKVTISEEFCEERDRKIAEDTRGESARMNWDFEYPEYHLSKVSGSMYQKWDGGLWKGKELTHHAFDVVHEFFGACDLKYLKKNGLVHISNYILRNLREGVTDHIVLWQWIKHPNGWNDIVQPGESGVYEIVAVIPAKDIVDLTTNNTFNYDDYKCLQEDEKYLKNL